MLSKLFDHNIPDLYKGNSDTYFIRFASIKFQKENRSHIMQFKREGFECLNCWRVWGNKVREATIIRVSQQHRNRWLWGVQLKALANFSSFGQDSLDGLRLQQWYKLSRSLSKRYLESYIFPRSNGIWKIMVCLFCVLGFLTLDGISHSRH